MITTFKEALMINRYQIGIKRASFDKIVDTI